MDLGVIDVLAEPVSELWNTTVLRDGSRAARQALAEMLENVDASIMLPGANPGHPVYAAIQDNLRKGIGRTIHFHWLQTGSAYTLPGQPLPPLHLVEATYQQALLQADYEALAAHQRRFEQAMRDGEVRVTSAAGTDLRFRIGNRPVNFQDGDASAVRAERGVILIDREIELPAGAVRVAPLEDSVSGTIAFPPSQWSGKAVTGLKLTFEAGNVVDVIAESGKAAGRSGNGESRIVRSVRFGNLRSAFIRCSRCQKKIHGFPTTAMVPGWFVCPWVIIRSWEETLVAAT